MEKFWAGYPKTVAERFAVPTNVFSQRLLLLMVGNAVRRDFGQSR